MTSPESGWSVGDRCWWHNPADIAVPARIVGVQSGIPLARVRGVSGLVVGAARLCTWEMHREEDFNRRAGLCASSQPCGAAPEGANFYNQPEFAPPTGFRAWVRRTFL
jgi:hypothetical protein